MSNSEEDKKGFAFPLEWVVPEDIDSKFATNVVVQHTNHEFIIYFFEAEQPLLTGSEEERKEQLENISEVEAKCIAKIAVPATRFPNMVKALQQNLEKFRNKFVMEEELEQEEGQ